jgi:hypothetical protein
MKALEAMTPPAPAREHERLRVFMFHGDADPVVPSPTRGAWPRGSNARWLGKTVTYTGTRASTTARGCACRTRSCCARWRDQARPQGAGEARKRSADRPWAALFGKPAARAAHVYVSTPRRAADVAAARALAQKLADWGPGVAVRFTVKSDVESRTTTNSASISWSSDTLSWISNRLPSWVTSYQRRLACW